MRSWPPLGILLGLAAATSAAHVAPIIVATLLGSAVYGAGSFGLRLLAGPGRRRIRELRTCRGDGDAGALDRAAQADLEQLSSALLSAERDLGASRIDAATFESVQGEVWRRLGADGLRRTR